ncbi:MAG: AEC family transporter [Clostridiaceae bacterium]|nr:AEC family transporter [Clostridiaceae bacterium]
MGTFSVLLKAQSVIITYIIIGVVLSRTGIITEKNRGSFTDFTLKVTLPCMVFRSFLGDMTPQMIKEGAAVLLVSSGVCIFAWLIGCVLFRFAEPKKQSIMKFSLLVGNVGFVGLPLVSSAFGEAGTFYGSFYLISNVVFNWSLGIAFLSPGVDGKALLKKVLLNPGIIGVVLGVARMLTGIQLPYTITAVVNSLGGITAPLGIIIIGSILAGCDVKTVFQKDVLYTAAMKLILLPLCLWIFMTFFGDRLGIGQEAYAVLMVMTAMPAGATTAILAQGYGQDHVFASKTVFVTTVLSIVTVPILAAFI